MTPGGIIPLWGARSSRNQGAASFRYEGRHHPGIGGGFLRNQQTLVGLRDRALISVMTFAFARISAMVAIRVEDYYPKGKRWWVRLHEKGGKRHEMPAHHNLEAYLDAYIQAAGIGN
jgi:hypothetical protein